LNSQKRVVIKKSKLNLIIDALLSLCLAAIAGIGFLIKYILVPGYQRREIYANCHPCVKYHANRARQMGIEEKEIQQAITNYSVNNLQGLTAICIGPSNRRLRVQVPSGYTMFPGQPITKNDKA